MEALHATESHGLILFGVLKLKMRLTDDVCWPYGCVDADVEAWRRRKSSARRGPVARVCEQGPLRECVLERLEDE